MKRLSNVISWFGNLANSILAAHLPVSIWLDSASLELYKRR